MSISDRAHTIIAKSVYSVLRNYGCSPVDMMSIAAREIANAESRDVEDFWEDISQFAGCDYFPN